METNNDLLKSFEKYWAANVRFLTCSLLGHCYTKFLPKNLGIGFTEVYITTKNGYSASYLRTKEREQYSEFIQENFASDVKQLQDFCQTIKQKADELLLFIDKNIEKKPNQKTWKEFTDLYCEYNGYHISPRHIIDFIDGEKIDRFTPSLEEVRLYTEHVHQKTEKFIEAYICFVAKQASTDIDLFWLCTMDEIEKYFSENIFPDNDVLQKRNENVVQKFTSQTQNIIYEEDEILSLENSMRAVLTNDTNIVQGISAYKGKVSGIVRLVFNPEEMTNFNENEILVTPMTRPDFLPLMNKASAFITDAGGMLCHAAIIAREMKKPCIIGTKIATQVLKDGMNVEVDADKGIVTILN